MNRLSDSQVISILSISYHKEINSSLVLADFTSNGNDGNNDNDDNNDNNDNNNNNDNNDNKK